MKRPRVMISAFTAAVLAGAAAAPPAFAQVRTGSLSGIVVDTRGAVVPDATIVVYPSDLSAPEAARTTTDGAGTFVISALQTGSYKILIDRDGWSEWAPGRITDAGKAVAYRVFAMRNTTANSVVTAAGIIAGRVTAPKGGPAPAIGVTVDDMSTASSWNTTTAADGRYSVSLPPGSTYVVSFTNGELTQHSPRTLDWALARRYTARTGHLTRVDERLLPPAMLGGRLVDEAGTPVSDAHVGLALLATAGEVWTVTGRDGRYQFEKLPPGDVVVGFTAPDGRKQWAYQKATAGEADVIALSLGTMTTVDETLLRAPGPAD